MNILEKEAIEIDYWKNSLTERPGKFTLENLINKIGDLEVFIECLKDLNLYILKDGDVLELGAGQGWASCAYKFLYPNVNITTTDISEYAISSLKYWEAVFHVHGIRSHHCKSYSTNLPNSSIDMIFCFAAAHHFIAHKRTLIEINRILRIGGRALYMFEPTTPRYFYRIAHWRVNRIRPEVPEDVLVISNLKKIALLAGFKIDVCFAPLLTKRKGFAAIYYKMMVWFPILKYLLPCSAHIIFEKIKEFENQK
jgi:ubiquinone/menaquinone biosynthesis C-methylase UbiE